MTEKFPFVLVLLLLMSVSLSTPLLAQEPGVCWMDYTVQPGDSLLKIAEKYYGERTVYRDIVDTTNAKAAADSSYATIADPAVIQPGWKLCLPEIAGTSPQVAAETSEAADVLSPDAIKNMSFQSEWIKPGSAKLSDGEYREPAAPGSAIETVIKLTDFIAFGELNDQPVAAVVLVTEPGGSGTFYDLALVAVVDGNPVNVTSTSLGDRVIVNSITIEDNEIVVDLVTHGPDDPMCCPTHKAIQRYALDDGRLKQTSALTNMPGAADSQPDAQTRVDFGPEHVAFDMVGIGRELSGSSVPAQAYDGSQPPGPTGAPAHVLFTSEGAGELRIYPTTDYEAMWNAAGDATVSNNIAQMRTVLAKRPRLPQAPLPYLPPNFAYNDLAVQIKFLDFANGSGIRFVGRFAQDASPVLNQQLRYVFQGLTEDGQYYVSCAYPISAANLVDNLEDMSPEQVQHMYDDFQGYLTGVRDTLDALSPADFVPTLSQLDALIQSLEISPPAVQAQAQESTLTGVTWKLTEIQKTNDSTTTIENPDRYTLLLESNGQVAIRADCNYGKGTYTTNGSQLAMGIDTLTRALCPLDSRSDDYIRMLNESRSYVLQGAVLFISYGIDSGTLKFVQ